MEGGRNEGMFCCVGGRGTEPLGAPPSPLITVPRDQLHGMEEDRVE